MKYYASFIILLFLISCSSNGTQIILNADNVEGITTETNITLNGFEIGKIKDMKLTLNGTIDIWCILNADTNIPNDSEFRIENLGFLSGKEIIIEPGKSQDRLKNGDFMKLTKTKSTPLGDSLSIKIHNFIKNFTSRQKQDSILIELRRLNENLEKLKK
ncbi:MlaD family protein [Aquimarina litoralis]|uniref:MlaD family protein n=1 Tax=Aquimarina litoralis TaxID=584605 RepID=UPI001C57637D|nr:MlaD family protein [Aquimarina litoralis]MBW1296311.1 MCE family protein [Aquimarina litoralis]